jgi:hypothetical protein
MCPSWIMVRISLQMGFGIMTQITRSRKPWSTVIASLLEKYRFNFLSITSFQPCIVASYTRDNTGPSAVLNLTSFAATSVECGICEQNRRFLTLLLRVCCPTLTVIKAVRQVSHHPKMAGNSLLGPHVFIYSFHLLGNQFSKIMFILLRSTHI